MALITKNLFRIVISLRVSPACAALQPFQPRVLQIHRIKHRSRIFLRFPAAICSICNGVVEPKRHPTRLLSWNRAAGYVPPRFDMSQGEARLRVHSATGEVSMVITSAHISPIIALIAGVLILLMPRLLNLVVAIYLICIGLIGLGVLRYFHIG
jgi:hypothetical protein